ncbi:MAG TPA: pseudouridine synthase, partial [Vicinamibacteria bacterium]
EGRVTVNGEPVREMGTKADLETDDVRVDGVRVKPPKGPVYVVLNKPRGVVTTRRDPEGRPTVMDLVPRVAGLFPVGRLDVTTEGLILLTNDGAFAERVSHPRYEVPRVYHAKVHRVPGPETLARLKEGVRVEGDFMAVDRARVIQSENNAWVELELHEGKQHEVKRLLEAVGHPVSKLKRVSFGPVSVKGLEPGQFRLLSPEEVAGLLRGEGRPAERIRRPPRRRPKSHPGTPPAPQEKREHREGREHRGPRGQREPRPSEPRPGRARSSGDVGGARRAARPGRRPR